METNASVAARAKISRLLASISTTQLKEVIVGLDTAPDSDAVFEMALNELEGRVTEAHFVAFCEAL